jgi:hypothetical protein
MFKPKLSSVSKSTSLTAQIRVAEQKILIRHRGAGVRATILIKKIHQEMTAPSTLLLAGGIGFIIGELTKRQTNNSRGTTDKPRAIEETSPLTTALNLIASAHTLYMALPIVWIMKSFNQPRTSGCQASKQQSRPVPTSSSAADNPRRPRR